MISHDRDFMDELVQTRLRNRGEQSSSATPATTADYPPPRGELGTRQPGVEEPAEGDRGHAEFIDRFCSVASKAAQAQSRERQLEKMEKLDKPRPLRKGFRFNFSAAATQRPAYHHADRRRSAYGAKQVLAPASTSKSSARERTCSSYRTVRANPHSSRSSPVRCAHSKGERKLGTNLKLGYFSQHRGDSLTRMQCAGGVEACFA